MVYNNSQYIFPRANELKNGLWLEVTPKKINLSAYSVNPRVKINCTNDGPTFKLLMPDKFNLAVTHTWEAYDSITSRLAELVAKYYRVTKTIGSGFGSIVDVIKQFSGYGTWGDVVNKLGTKALTTEPIVPYRIDSPLVYKNSNNLEYNLVLDLVARNKGDTKYLADLVNDLLKLSSPGAMDWNNAVNYFLLEPPHLFELKTSNLGSSGQQPSQPLLNLKYAAITSIQPEYKGPYIDGGPISISLTLTFSDVTPLFDSTFSESGTSVTVEKT